MFVDVWHKQKHAWPLQEAWITRKRREKRKRDSNWISCLSLLYFSLFLSSLSLSLSLSLSCQYSSLLTQEKQRQSFSCVFALIPKQETFLLYLRLYKKLYYSNFRIFLSKIRPQTVRKCTTESGRNVVAYGWKTTLSTSPDEVLSANIGILLLDVGVFVSGMATSHCFCKLASAGGWWKLTDRRCLDCLLHAWRASKVNP